MAQLQSSLKTSPIDEDFLTLIKVDNKGWNLALFNEPIKAYTAICTDCNSVCCDAVELACDHDDDDQIGLLYCNQCLLDLIRDNHNKCIIDSHENPIITASRPTRRQISKLAVACPFTAKFQSRCQQQQQQQLQHANNIVDTMGNEFEQKEGIIPRPRAACHWEGSFKQLITTHLPECIRKNDPLFALNVRIKILESEKTALQNELNAQRQVHESETVTNLQMAELQQAVHSLTAQNRALRESRDEQTSKVSKLEAELAEQTRIIQELLTASTNQNNEAQQVRQAKKLAITQKAENERLLQENEKLKKKIRALKQKCVAQSTCSPHHDHHALEASNESLRRGNEKLKQQISGLKQKTPYDIEQEARRRNEEYFAQQRKANQMQYANPYGNAQPVWPVLPPTDQLRTGAVDYGQLATDYMQAGMDQYAPSSQQKKKKEMNNNPYSYGWF